MKALKEGFFTSIAHLSRILVGFFLLKLIAFYLGPSGLGQLGHFMSALAILSLMAGGGISNALVKYVAEFKKEQKKLLLFVNESFSYSVIFSVVFSLLVVLSAQYLAQFFLRDSNLYWVFWALVGVQFGLILINYVVAISSVLKGVFVYSKIQIIGSLLAIPFIWYLLSSKTIIGAALAIISVYLGPLVPAFVAFKRSDFWGKISYVRISRSTFKKLNSFTLMLVISVTTFPLVELVVRELLIRNAGYDSAGIWQGAIKLSAAYLGFFNVFLTYYFLPQISPLDCKVEICKKTFKTQAIVASVFLLGSSVLYFGRGYIIPLLFSTDFNQLTELIGYQLLADFFRISAYVMGFVAVAKAATKVYILAEIIQNGMFLLLVALAGTDIHVRGVMISYLYVYVTFFVLSFCCFLLYVSRSK